MNQKQIGIIILVFSILLAGVFYFIKVQQDKTATDYAMLNKGVCVTEEGVCLHERSSTTFTIGLVISVFLLALGTYLALFDKAQELLMRQHKEVSKALKESKQTEKFEAFLAGFNEEEKKVLKAVKDQDGILQSTLRYRTGIGKASLSLILKALEEKGVISRKEEGKTNKVFMKKAY